MEIISGKKYLRNQRMRVENKYEKWDWGWWRTGRMDWTHDHGEAERKRNL